MRKIIFTNSIVVLLLAFSMAVSANDMLKEKSGIKYKDIRIGEGSEAVMNKAVTIHLALWSNVKGEKGKKLFDSHEAGSDTISFILGTDIIPDVLNIGVKGMQVGGIRRLYIPAELNPKKGSGNFPGNAPIIYEVELLEVK